MVLITFDENDIEVKHLIDDYFWYMYYVKSIENDFKYFIKYNGLKMQNFELILNQLNQIEIKRLVDIHNRYFKYTGFLSKKSEVVNDEIKVIHNILGLGYKFWKDEFKELLLEHPNIIKSLK